MPENNMFSLKWQQWSRSSVMIFRRGQVGLKKHKLWHWTYFLTVLFLFLIFIVWQWKGEGVEQTLSSSRIWCSPVASGSGKVWLFLPRVGQLTHGHIRLDLTWFNAPSSIWLIRNGRAAQRGTRGCDSLVYFTACSLQFYCLKVSIYFIVCTVFLLWQHSEPRTNFQIKCPSQNQKSSYNWQVPEFVEVSFSKTLTRLFFPRTISSDFSFFGFWSIRGGWKWKQEKKKSIKCHRH